MDKDNQTNETKINVKINTTKQTVSNTPQSVEDTVPIVNESRVTTEPSIKELASPTQTSTPKVTRRSNSSRGLVISGLAVFAILAITLTSIVNRASGPDHAKIVKVSSPIIANVIASPEGFTPATVVVKRGTVVSWTGPDSGNPIIIASNPYPSDNKLRTLKSNQLNSGATYRYKFNDSGTYTYHDDLNPYNNGTIIVE